MDSSKLFVALAIPLLFVGNKDYATLVIKQNNKILYREKITKTDKKVFKIRLSKGYVAKVMVFEGKAWVERMPTWVCPKHICSDMGKIGFDDNRKLVCAPNELIVYFER